MSPWNLVKSLKSFTDFEAFFGLSLGFKAVCWEVWKPLSSNFPCRSVVFFLYGGCGVCGQCELWDQSHCDASLTSECWVMSSITDFSLLLELKVCFGETDQVILLLSLASKPLGQHRNSALVLPPGTVSRVHSQWQNNPGLSSKWFSKPHPFCKRKMIFLHL